MRDWSWSQFLPALAIAFVFLAGGAKAQRQSAISQAQLQQGATGQDWPTYGGTYVFWRYNSLNQINMTNVKKLVPVWMFQTVPALRSLDRRRSPSKETT